jgi:hypothetical protein
LYFGDEILFDLRLELLSRSAAAFTAAASPFYIQSFRAFLEIDALPKLQRISTNTLLC